MGNSVILEQTNEVATLYLNAPDSLNAMSAELKSDFTDMLRKTSSDSSIKSVILAGKGRAFCAGGDVKGMEKESDSATIKAQMDVSVGIIKFIREMEKPIIAAVHGYAAGAGFSIALASDLIIAEEDSKFILAFKNVGLIPDLGGHYFLPRLVGPWKAKEWFWKGARLTAEEGERYGFVNHVVPAGQAHRKAMEIAQELAQGPAKAYAETKRIMNETASSVLNLIMEWESYSQTMLRRTRDHREGLQAFREKRDPQFKGE